MMESRLIRESFAEVYRDATRERVIGPDPSVLFFKRNLKEIHTVGIINNKNFEK